MNTNDFDYLMNKAKTAVHQYAVYRKSTSPVIHSYVQPEREVMTYNITAETEYFCKGKRYIIKPGMLVYTPRGAEFSSHALKSGENISIRFYSLFDQKAEINDLMVFSDFSKRDVEAAFRGVVKAYLSNDEASYFKCQAELNKIFFYLAKGAGKHYPSKKTAKIEAAVNYMNEHYLEPDFSISKLVELANISNTYFCRLFCGLYGMPPMQYVINRRIEFAKDIIANEPETPVYEIAERAGYGDPFYFSRLFKKYTGQSPAAYILDYR